MSVIITGAAGFIGSNLAARLLQDGHNVVGLDNLSRGEMANLDAVRGHGGFRFERVDLADLLEYRSVLTSIHEREPITEIWHMAANSDIPGGIADARVDLRDTFMTTFNTLELMRELDVRILAFASSSAVYGDLGTQRLVEDTGPLFPISNYGAMKLASEAVISAAVESHLDNAFIFRFPNVVGVPATHGVILDFLRKLAKRSDHLDVLGDGTQQKGYLHVDDLIGSMLYIRTHASQPLNYYNIGAADEGVTVRFIAEQVVHYAAPNAELRFGEGNKGWVGDVPRFAYSTDKLARLGWTPSMSSAESVIRAIRQIQDQERRS